MNDGSTELERAVAEAFTDPEPRSGANRAKALIADELRRLDRRVSVVRTAYFNYNYVPDLVLEWRERGVQRSREVFLRFDLSDASVAADVAALDDLGGMFVALQRTEDERREAVVVGDVPAERSMLTQAAAFEQLDTFGDGQPVARLVTTSLVRTGRGVVRVRDAARIVTQTTGTLTAIRAGDGADLNARLPDLTAHLAEEHAVQLERYLQLTWQVYGHDLEEFPAPSRLSGKLSDAEVAELLGELFTQPVLDDDAFWRRLGGLVDLPALEAFGDVAANPNLSRLVAANTDRLRAVVLGMQQRHPELFQNPTDLQWSIVDRSLALTGAGFVVLLATDRRRFGQWRSTHPLPAWEEFVSRVDRYQLLQVMMVGPTSQVDVRRPEAKPALRPSRRLRRDSARGHACTVGDSGGRGCLVSRRRRTWTLGPRCRDGGTSIGTLTHAGIDVFWAPDEEFAVALEQVVANPPGEVLAVDLLQFPDEGEAAG